MSLCKAKIKLTTEIPVLMLIYDDVKHRWKIKCKKLERDLDKHRNNAEQAQSRSDQVIKDLEMSRSESTSSVQQLDHLKREFAELLVSNKRQNLNQSWYVYVLEIYELVL